jgi:hypothetical protein
MTNTVAIGAETGDGDLVGHHSVFDKTASWSYPLRKGGDHEHKEVHR